MASESVNSCSLPQCVLMRQFRLGFGQHLDNQETSIHNRNTSPRISKGYR